MIDAITRQKILAFQKSEITEHFIYEQLAASIKEPANQEILRQIAKEELAHYQVWKSYSYTEVKPEKWKVWLYVGVARIFGLTFTLKYMEQGERRAQLAYDEISQAIPRAKEIEKEEEEHERAVLNMIEEEKLEYIGSAVLGLNDALVELTGALAGLTFALQHTRLVAVAGLITGIAASFSMAASEYLSTKSEESGKNPVKAAIYTGTAYVLTVLFLIFPYLIFSNIFFCLAFSLTNAVLVILIFTFYISVAKDLPFAKRFWEMFSISMGVALLSFVFGIAIRLFFNLEV